jgi:cysteinyl-tRNA synthetase
MNSPIFLTNTMTRTKEEFIPLTPGMASLYTCGLTVYNYPHEGNRRAYVFADTLKRVLLYNGYNVNHVMNVTDVGHLASDEDEGEDKLQKQAQQEHRSVWEIAAFYTEAFLADLATINIIPPKTLARATQHVPEMIALIQRLEMAGFTYLSGGNVYLDTSKIMGYGRMAKLKLNRDTAISRVEPDKNKQNPFDSVLWFTKYKYSSHEMLWDSPWGVGFPGWHIECSAMAMKYLGERIDIHTGGIDHIPVHHSNEIAQSEAAIGHEWVNYWLHVEFLSQHGEKMAKSKGGFVRLVDLEQLGFSAMDIRYYYLNAHYRAKLEFNQGALQSASNSMRRLREKLANLRKLDDGNSNASDAKSLAGKFLSAVNNDLNTPQALAVLWEVVNSHSLSPRDKVQLVESFDQVLGLKLLNEESGTIPKEILVLAEQRLVAKSQKSWADADILRSKIEAQGYEIRDTKDGYEIKQKVQPNTQYSVECSS